MSKKKGKSRQSKSRKKQLRKPVSKGPQIKKWHLLILVGAVILAFLPVFQAEFVDIDDAKLLLNRGEKFIEQPMSVFQMSINSPHYKPVVYFSWMVEYNLFKDNPLPYHINNLILHLLNCLLFFFLTRRLCRRFPYTKGNSDMIAFFTALLFGLHPLHVESVAWVIERKDVLYTFFFLISILLYLRFVDNRKYLPLIGSSVAFLLSVFSKSPGVMLFPILFLFDFFYQRKFDLKLFTEKIGYFIILLFALYNFGVFSTGTAEGEIGDLFSEEKLTLAENVVRLPTFYSKILLMGMKSLLWYLHTLFPFNNALAYPQKEFVEFFGIGIHLMPILILGASGVLLYLRKKKTFWVFTHTFFVLALLPAIIRSSPGVGIFLSDRYVYLASFGVIFFITAFILNLPEKGMITSKIKTGILIAIALIYAVTTFSGARTWHNAETLWSNVINKYPQVSYAWVNRGSFYRDQGQYEIGLQDLNKALEVEETANAFIQRGLVFRQMGKPSEALKDYNKALEEEPDNFQAVINRGNTYLDLQRFPEAIQDYNLYLGKHSGSVRALTNRAAALASSNRFDEALADLNSAQEKDPNYKDLYLNRAILYFNTGKFQKAIDDYDAFLRLNPGDHQSYYDKGIIYQRMNQHQQAIESFNQAIAINPNIGSYYRNRAFSYDALGNKAQAASDRATVQRLK